MIKRNDFFSGISIEDSFVLDIIVLDGAVIFEMDFALLRNHRLYEPPVDRGAYCFRKGRILFSDLSKPIKLIRTRYESRDKSGEIDYGHIDEVKIDSRGRYILSGDWGNLEISSASPAVQFQ